MCKLVGKRVVCVNSQLYTHTSTTYKSPNLCMAGWSLVQVIHLVIIILTRYHSKNYMHVYIMYKDVYALTRKAFTVFHTPVHSLKLQALLHYIKSKALYMYT